VLAVTIQVGREKGILLVLLKARQQSLQGRLNVADDPERDRMPSSYMRGIGVDLNDRGPVGIELAPGEISPEQEQHIAVQNGVIAGGSANDAGHADIVGIVVFDEVLAAGCVRHRRFQSRRRGNNFVVRAGASGAGVDCDLRTLVEDGGNRIESASLGRMIGWRAWTAYGASS